MQWSLLEGLEYHPDGYGLFPMVRGIIQGCPSRKWLPRSRSFKRSWQQRVIRKLEEVKTGGKEARRMAFDCSQLCFWSCHVFPGGWLWVPALHLELPGCPLVPACPQIALCCPHLVQAAPGTVHLWAWPEDPTPGPVSPWIIQPQLC